MKRPLITLALLALAATAAMAQARFTSNTERHDLGQVEWKHPATAEYTITNTGTEPLVLTNVEPDCACTVARWTQTPIAPGEKGTLSVTFDAEALGTFHKAIAVYTNAQPHLLYLYLAGQVVREVRDFSRTHPVQMGRIRLDKGALRFGDVTPAANPVIRLSVVNESDQPYRPVLMHLPSYLSTVAEPPTLQPGESGFLSVTLHTDKVHFAGEQETTVYLSRFMGDKVEGDNRIPVSLCLLPDFSGMTATQLQNAPDAQLSATAVDVSALLAKKKKAVQDVLLTNTGRTELTVLRIQSLHPAIAVDLKSSKVQAGQSARLRLTVSRKHLHRQGGKMQVIVLTDSPQHPKLVIDVKAEP